MSAQDWSHIIAATGQGASSAMQGATQHATARSEAKEAKRRTLANLLTSATKRNRGLLRMGQEHGGEMNDYQSQALQQIARGFVESLQNIGRG